MKNDRIRCVQRGVRFGGRGRVVWCVWCGAVWCGVCCMNFNPDPLPSLGALETKLDATMSASGRGEEPRSGARIDRCHP
jgi:hypothetical protein